MKLVESKESTATDGCTFKPKVLNKKFANKKETTVQQKLSKWDELFVMAKGKRKEKQDK